MSLSTKFDTYLYKNIKNNMFKLKFKQYKINIKDICFNIQYNIPYYYSNLYKYNYYLNHLIIEENMNFNEVSYTLRMQYISYKNRFNKLN